MKRKQAIRYTVHNAEPLRDRVRTFCLELGGVEERPSEYNSVTGYVVGGTVRVPLPVGALLVHLPSDCATGLFSVCTHFVDGAPLPADANPHSGKWNFYDEDQVWLYTDFIQGLQKYVATQRRYAGVSK